MKKSIVLVTTLLASLTAVPVAMAASALPHQVEYRFECPNASGGVPSERLTNFGTFIRGMGEENVNGVKVSLPVFKGIPSAGVPLDLSTGGYSHAGTEYNASTGRITCLYVSGLGADPFNVSYVTDNAKHGFVVKSNNSNITIVAESA